MLSSHLFLTYTYTAHPSYSNCIVFRFMNASNTKLSVCVTTQSLVPPPLTFLNELLQLYSPSCFFCSSSDTRILKLRRFNHKIHGFRAFSNTVLTSGTTSSKMSDTIILSLPSETNSRHFSEHFNWLLLSFTPIVCIVFVCAHLCECLCVWRVCVYLCMHVCVWV